MANNKGDNDFLWHLIGTYCARGSSLSLIHYGALILIFMFHPLPGFRHSPSFTSIHGHVYFVFFFFFFYITLKPQRSSFVPGASVLVNTKEDLSVIFSESPFVDSSARLILNSSENVAVGYTSNTQENEGHKVL